MSTGSFAMNPTLERTRTRAARRVFLSARWQCLAMLNWEIEPTLVEPLVPRGTELDFHRGKTFVSAVGFLFLDTRVLGLPVPMHRDFEEVNLRFYVRREAGGEVRRGVAFIKEIVPRWAIAQTARWCYNEPYVALPMRHAISGPAAERVQGSGVRVQGSGVRGQESGVRRAVGVSPLRATTQAATVSEGSTQAATVSEGSTPARSVSEGAGRVAYSWQTARRWNTLEVEYDGPPRPLTPGSHEEFIAEHYWGYCAQRDGGTVEYQVEHPPWNVWPVTAARLDCDLPALYGHALAEVLSQPPTTALLADGSEVAVMQPERLCP